MSRSYWPAIVAIIGCLMAAVIIGLWLQPEQPRLSGDSGYQEISSSYQAGGAECQPAALSALSRGKRPSKATACEEAKEQHQETANGLIGARRQADAAEASAIASSKQTGIAALGTGLGFVPMIAAIGAAVFAERTAHYTRLSAEAAREQVDVAIKSIGLNTTGMELMAEANKLSRLQYNANFRPKIVDIIPLTQVQRFDN